jgi:hypothetical protein
MKSKKTQIIGTNNLGIIVLGANPNFIFIPFYLATSKAI